MILNRLISGQQRLREPVAGQHQDKNGYKFTINDRSAFYDRYNAYFEMQFQVQKLSDGTYYDNDRITVINGSHSFINHLMIKSAGKIVYDTDNLHKVTFVKNLSEHSDDFSRLVAKNSFWYLDTNSPITSAHRDLKLGGFLQDKMLLVMPHKTLRAH